MGRLQDKVAVITGGARGMGAATSRLFAREGAIVVIADMLEAEGTALADELGGSASFVKLNVADEPAWASMTADLLQRHGRIDALVNNAGVLSFGELVTADVAEFDRVYAVNVKGPFLGMKHVGGAMRAAGRGSIVNIASIDGFRGANALGIYSSSKWALRGMTKTAALELGPLGVRERPSFAAAAKQLNRPTLVLWGEQDHVFPVKQAEIARDVLPDVCVQRIDNCGHYPHWEAPERFLSEVRAFLPC